MKVGRSTIYLDKQPGILGFAAVGGKKESEGPLAHEFDHLYIDTTLGEKTFEKAESLMQKDAANRAIQKANLTSDEIDIVFAGDLLNQCIGSSYGLRELGIPFAGLYGACSTMAESLLFASLFVEGGFANHALAVTSSHFCSSERQFRFPLEYGGQRPPSAQWTATASGSVVVGIEDSAPYIKAVCLGKMMDLGVKDMNNMGAAMAPAAADTISTFLQDSGTKPSDYDLILTGDLGLVGSELLITLMRQEYIDISAVHNDCGLLLYDREKQDVHAGGSGCGCSAAVLCSTILKKLRQGELKNVLFIATGALMSPTSNQQGESIPSIAHLVYLTNERGGK